MMHMYSASCVSPHGVVKSIFAKLYVLNVNKHNSLLLFIGAPMCSAIHKGCNAFCMYGM